MQDFYLSLKFFFQLLFKSSEAIAATERRNHFLVDRKRNLSFSVIGEEVWGWSMALSGEEVGLNPGLGVRKDWLSFSSSCIIFQIILCLRWWSPTLLLGAFQQHPSTPACNSGDFSGTSSSVALALRAGLATLLEGRLHIDLTQKIAMPFKDPDTKKTLTSGSSALFDLQVPWTKQTFPPSFHSCVGCPCLVEFCIRSIIF